MRLLQLLLLGCWLLAAGLGLMPVGFHERGRVSDGESNPQSRSEQQLRQHASDGSSPCPFAAPALLPASAGGRLGWEIGSHRT